MGFFFFADAASLAFLGARGFLGSVSDLVGRGAFGTFRTFGTFGDVFGSLGIFAFCTFGELVFFMKDESFNAKKI